MKDMFRIMNFLFVIFTASLTLSSSAFSHEENSTVVADFDSGDAVNNLGGKIEVWLAENGADPNQSAKMSFIEDDAEGNASGKSLKIDYDVESESAAYNGIRMDLNHFDASEFKTFNFYIKGDAKAGFPPTLKIELIGENGKPSPHMFTGITTEWQKITIPLSEFVLIKDWTKLQKFVVVFADIESNPKEGTVYLDDVYFSKS